MADAVDHARREHADLQGDEAVPQLRRQQVDVRRYERRGDAARTRTTSSAFAAQRGSDGALTVMVINKALSSSAPVTINLANFTPAGAAQAWQLTSANSITRLADIPIGGTSFVATAAAAERHAVRDSGEPFRRQPARRRPG